MGVLGKSNQKRMEENISVVTDGVKVAKEASDSGTTPVHFEQGLPGGERCRCGCVPNIMGTFEMAALRAKRREELARTKQAAQGSGEHKTASVPG